MRGDHICVILYVHKQKWDADVNYSNYTRQVTFVYPHLANGLGAFDNLNTSRSEPDGSRREESNTPSTDYDSVALTLSYTGEFVVL